MSDVESREREGVTPDRDQTSVPATVGPSTRPLLGIAAVAFLARLAYALFVVRDRTLDYDALWYRTVAVNLAEGRGWVVECPLIASCQLEPTANFGPLHPLMLSVLAFFGFDSPTELRMVGCVLGAASCYLIGRLGTALVGRRAGLLAAGLAAVYPMLLGADGSLMSETLYLFLVLLLLNALATGPSSLGLRRAAALGALVGLAALTRGEGLFLLPLVVAPWLVVHRRDQQRHLLATLAVAGLATVAVMTPWTVHATRTFDRLVVTNNLNTVIAGANCRSTYYGKLTGFWDFDCLRTGRPEFVGRSEAETGKVFQQEGIDYATGHPSRLPVVALARLSRTWGVVTDGQLNLEQGETRSLWGQEAGWLMYVGLVPLAALGGWRLRRSRRLSVLLVAPMVLVSVTSILTYGNERFRIAAEPSLLILAATGLLWLYDARRARGMPVSSTAST